MVLFYHNMDLDSTINISLYGLHDYYIAYRYINQIILYTIYRVFRTVL